MVVVCNFYHLIHCPESSDRTNCSYKLYTYQIGTGCSHPPPPRISIRRNYIYICTLPVFQDKETHMHTLINLQRFKYQIHKSSIGVSYCTAMRITLLRIYSIHFRTVFAKHALSRKARGDRLSRARDIAHL
jgi:hypothetical protein